MTCNRFHTMENVKCPNCARPVSVLRGLDADCQPIAMVVHRVDRRTWRPGTFKIAA